MDAKTLILISLPILVGLILLLLLFCKRDENFNIPLENSNPWGLNVGNYKQNDTGYGLYGVFPGSIPYKPWQYWMWARRPLDFYSSYTPVPQIDYNYAPPLSTPIYNITIGTLLLKNKQSLTFNGKQHDYLNFVRNRPYYLHLNLPFYKLLLIDKSGNTLKVLSGQQTVQLQFSENDPAQMIMALINKQGTIIDSTKIYLENTRWH